MAGTSVIADASNQRINEVTVEKRSLLLDVVGLNDAGEVCHPYTASLGAVSGLYTYKLKPGDRLEHVDEEGLRRMIETGKFDGGGVIRMMPVHQNVNSHGEMAVRKYKGKALPRFGYSI